MYDKTTIGNCIVASRGRRRMTRLDLSEATGIPVSTLEGYENAKTSISLENAWRIADAFGMEIDDLFERRVPA